MHHPSRCPWAKPTNENYLDYHDNEWGVPVTSDRTLFEFLILEGAQAGLSWETILNKRPAYREVFHQFDIAIVAGLPPTAVDLWLQDSRLVRNCSKLASTITNAQKTLDIQREYGSFANYLWRFVDYQPIQNNFVHHEDIPVETALSKEISNDLKSRGVKFFGPTICYAFMQAVGMVNDHLQSCFRYQQVAKLGQSVHRQLTSSRR